MKVWRLKAKAAAAKAKRQKAALGRKRSSSSDDVSRGAIVVGLPGRRPVGGSTSELPPSSAPPPEVSRSTSEGRLGARADQSASLGVPLTQTPPAVGGGWGGGRRGLVRDRHAPLAHCSGWGVNPQAP